jgi:hypothetical protein
LVEAVRWLLLAALLLDLVVGLITLPRDSPVTELQRDLRAGQVRSIAFAGTDPVRGTYLVLDRDSLGLGQNAIVWRTGTLSYKSARLELGSDVFGGPAGDSDTEPALRQRITTAANAAGVPIKRSLDQELLGRWRQTTILVYLILLVTLIRAGQPRRATKWATFWLLLLPLSAGMILTLAREAPWSRRARELPEPLPHKLQVAQGPDERLTGGRAFLLLVVAGAVVKGVVALAERR